MLKVIRPEQLPAVRLSEIDAYTYDDLPKLENLVDYGMEHCDLFKRRNRPDLISDFATFDIETTTIPADSDYAVDEDPYAIPYLYQVYLFGRVWFFREDWQFKHFFETLEEILRNRSAQLTIYVHNLSFEYQFLKSRVPLDFNTVFAMQSRRIAKVESKNHNLLFKCSYILSNMSLEKFTQNYCDEQYRKDKELIDYEVIRFPWDVLENEIYYYGAMDVITLYHAVKSIMEKEGDTIKTIPLTNTGYVRRVCRTACLGDNTKDYHTEEGKKTYPVYKRYKAMLIKCMPTLEQYQMLRDAFRGGNTHANRYKAGQIIENVASKDFTSSYPAALIAYDGFPMGKLMDCTASVQDPDRLQWYISKYWLIMEVVFLDLELRDPYHTPCPYIPVAKTTHEKKYGIYDNGRIIKQLGYTKFTFLGIEWDLIKKQYKGRYKILRAFYTVAGYLPNGLRKSAYEFYKAKTELKGVAGKEYEYMKGKNRANSTYGMMVEQPVKNIIKVDDHGDIVETAPTAEEAQNMLLDYTKPKNRKFLLYQWGVTITAIARVRHMEIIDIVGSDFVYGDTDSVKYTDPEKYEPLFDEYNKTWIKYADQCGVPISAKTVEGKTETLGILDTEKPAARFVTLGAKKYCYEDAAGDLHLTVAGVPKKAGEAMLGKIENFKPGFVFSVPDSGSLKDRQDWKKLLTYRDDLDMQLTIEGHTLPLKTCIAMTRTTYNLGITQEYSDLTGFTDRYEEDPEIWI